MSFVISTYSTVLHELSERQIFRYMGMACVHDDELSEHIRSVLPEFLNILSCKACYGVVPITINGNTVDLDVISVESGHLARNLRGCDRAIVFAATLGMETEQQKRRASVVSPTKALILDAMGSAAIERFCDLFCEEIQKMYPTQKLRPRFSPGYGDFSLEAQKQLLRVLDAQRKIGVSIAASFLMLPQKSVTAVVGLAKDGCIYPVPSCDDCSREGCEFRL